MNDLHDAAPDPASDRPTDDALWASIGETLRTVVLPALVEGRADAWARVQTVQLIALAEIARTRGADPAPRRRHELAVTLASIAGNPLLGDHRPGDEHAAAAAALAAAVGRTDPDAEQVRATLRPVLVAQLDDELTVSSPLIEAFRGRLPR